jgi:chaperonin cofactor prefoldin
VPSVSVEDLERRVAEAEKKEELLERKLEMMSQEVQEYPVSFMG